MRPLEAVDLGSSVPVERLRTTLEAHPVTVAILFGSHTTDRSHPDSDIDLAIELDGLRPGDAGYNDAFFGVSAEVNVEVGSVAVDVVDVHTLSPALVRAVFDDGVLLLGSIERAEALRSKLTVDDGDSRSPRERFDAAVKRIDEHLS
jgi:predicted nucleotidyltransferase